MMDDGLVFKWICKVKINFWGFQNNSIKIVKRIFTKAGWEQQRPKKSNQNYGESIKNRTISGNSYDLVWFEIVLYQGLY